MLSVFAIRLENRYKGIRAPHKVKMAVSGCTRECAEAQCKDVGLIATENGYNIYVCGNGGATPRHADLLVADVDSETAIQFIDRFFIYYIMSADKLTRTAAWCEKLEGGIGHIREVVVEDRLGIADELDQMMQHLVDTYQCEWKTTVENPELPQVVPAVREYRRHRTDDRNRIRTRANAARQLGLVNSCPSDSFRHSNNVAMKSN